MYRLQIPTGRNRSRSFFAHEPAELRARGQETTGSVLTRYPRQLGGGQPRAWIWSGEHWRPGITPRLWHLVREPGTAVLLATRCALTAVLFALTNRRGYRQAVPVVETWAGVLPGLLLCRDYFQGGRRWVVA